VLRVIAMVQHHLPSGGPSPTVYGNDISLAFHHPRAADGRFLDRRVVDGRRLTVRRANLASGNSVFRHEADDGGHHAVDQLHSRAVISAKIMVLPEWSVKRTTISGPVPVASIKWRKVPTCVSVRHSILTTPNAPISTTRHTKPASRPATPTPARYPTADIRPATDHSGPACAGASP
jgi:hypothetical protein